MAVIEVTDLRKSYQGREVLRGVSFSVEQGEIFGIVGPNGAGKTSTVECVEGLRHRDGGGIRVLGLDPQRPADRAALRRQVGVQLQQAQLQENLRVREALELYASFYDHPRDPAQLLEQWDLTDRADARFGKLSGGQQQRLFIALALVGNPSVVFLDELTAGLDPQARRDAWELVNREAAARLFISEATVKTHLLHIYAKLDVTDRASAVAAGYQRGLLTTGGTPR
jgi:ABC-2 type transport system ATP-binding protein